MNDNPFAALVKTIRDDNNAHIPANYRLGYVITVTPLQVNVGGAIQDNEALLKNEAITNIKIGDRLLLIPIEEEQRYIIVCKVVDA